MNELFLAATQAMGKAYCPHSGYAVGAAVLTSDGRVFSGCNVENDSYGLSMCAERCAVFAMVRAGGSSIKEVAIASKNGGTPCGACLQVLFQFAPDAEQTKIFLLSESSETEFTLKQLLPEGFRLIR